MPDSVNSQMTDSVTQVNTGVLSDAPAVAIGTLYQSLAHSSGLALFNATSNQQNLNQLNPAIVSQAVAKINSS